MRRISRFWRGINENAAIPAEVFYPGTHEGFIPTAMKLTAPGGAGWGLEDVKEILVRNCYDEAVNLLTQLVDNRADPEYHACALIKGSSNIGKSVFIPYLIYRILRHAVAAGEERPTFALKSPDDNGTFHLFYDADGQTKVENIDNAPYGTILVDYFISDTIPAPGFEANKLNLHLTSVWNEKAHNYRKRITTRFGRLIIFPPFSFEEYAMCRGQNCHQVNLPDGRHVVTYENEELLHYQYDILGGCIGSLVIVDSETYSLDSGGDLDTLTIVQDELKSFFDHVYVKEAEGEENVLVTTKYKHMLTRAARFIGSELSVIIAKVRGITSRSEEILCLWKSLFTHMYLDTDEMQRYVSASKFMSYLAVAFLYRSQEMKIWGEIQQMLLRSSDEGVFFEKMGHEELIRKLTSDRGLKIQRIGNPSTGRSKKPKEHGADEIVRIPNLRKVFIRTWRDIENLREGEYGYPVIPNFTLVDAVIPRSANKKHLAIQFTKKSSHCSDLINAHYEEFREHFPDINDNSLEIAFLFVVPEYSYQDFQCDPKLPSSHYHQYKVKSDIVTLSVGEKRSSSEL